MAGNGYCLRYHIDTRIAAFGAVMTTEMTKTQYDIALVRQALKIAAQAKPTPVWECENALPAFERMAELIDHYVPKGIP